MTRTEWKIKVPSEDEVIRIAAQEFLEKAGLEPTPDAIEQLVFAFLPALQIMCVRGYDPEGLTWRAEGWRGMLWKIHDKFGRIWFFGWKRGKFHPDSVIDLINYSGFYYRTGHDGPEWGTRGEPGTDLPEDTHVI